MGLDLQFIIYMAVTLVSLSCSLTMAVNSIMNKVFTTRGGKIFLAMAITNTIFTSSSLLYSTKHAKTHLLTFIHLWTYELSTIFPILIALLAYFSSHIKSKLPITQYVLPSILYSIGSAFIISLIVLIFHKGSGSAIPSWPYLLSGGTNFSIFYILFPILAFIIVLILHSLSILNFKKSEYGSLVSYSSFFLKLLEFVLILLLPNFLWMSNSSFLRFISLLLTHSIGIADILLYGSQSVSFAGEKHEKKEKSEESGVELQKKNEPQPPKEDQAKPQDLNQGQIWQRKDQNQDQSQDLSKSQIRENMTRSQILDMYKSTIKDSSKRDGPGMDESQISFMDDSIIFMLQSTNRLDVSNFKKSAMKKEN